jgi:predicted Zn-dependent protease
VFSDRVLQLEVLRQGENPQLIGCLSQVQRQALASSQSVFAVAEWMLRTGQSADAAAWLKTLAPDQLAKQPIPLIAVECFASRDDWAPLEAMLDSQNWGELEYYRMVLRAKVHREKNEDTAARSAWLRGLKATDNRVERLSQLARVVTKWGWNDEGEQVMEIITQRFPSEKWAVQKLSASLYSRGKTMALKNLLARTAETDPTNLRVKNNLVMTSLLLDGRDARMHKLALELYQKQPDNPFFVSTYAYSLHLQEKSQEALDLFQKLKPEQLEEPTVAAYYGIVLADTGKPALARKYLDLGEHAALLPEEKNLLKQARTRT